MDNRKLSTIKSSLDKNDYILDNIINHKIVLPQTLDLKKKLKKIINQNDIFPSCFYVGLCIFEYNFKKNFKINLKYSNKIMSGRELMSILLKDGLEDKNNNIHKIKAYGRINTMDGLKKALYLYGPCYISFPYYKNNNCLWKPNFRGQKMEGGHCFLVVGYNNNGFILRNSWGKQWGDKGYCIYNYSDFGYHWEIWSIMDDESYYEENINYNKKKLFNCFL